MFSLLDAQFGYLKSWHRRVLLFSDAIMVFGSVDLSNASWGDPTTACESAIDPHRRFVRWESFVTTPIHQTVFDARRVGGCAF